MITTVRKIADAERRSATTEIISTNGTDWLPVLHASGVTVRPLRASDAESLHRMLSVEEVSRFISPPPTTVEAYVRFIEWTAAEAAAGRNITFGLVPAGCECAVGFIQIRRLSRSFDVAEWGFALGSAFWGTGIFEASARVVLGFAFETVGVERLEARACVANGRGNGALMKCGAVCEALLRASFVKSGRRLDQYLWSITRDHWRATVPQALLVH